MLMKFGHDPLLFVILTGVVFFAWGEIYSLFPSTCADTFGTKYATTNAGLLYTAKGTASLLVPFANIAVAQFGSWDAVFVVAAFVNAVAALLALLVLKPPRSWRCSCPTSRGAGERGSQPVWLRAFFRCT
jgi:OFA family oxalate/formate antiporter-like MFS transporter